MTRKRSLCSRRAARARCLRYIGGVRRVLALWLLTLGPLLASCGSAQRSPAAPPEPSDGESPSNSEGSTRSLTPRQIADRSTASVVSVRSEGSLGTGFVVRADGWIATNLGWCLVSHDLAFGMSIGAAVNALVLLGALADRALGRALARIVLPLLAMTIGALACGVAAWWIAPRLGTLPACAGGAVVYALAALIFRLDEARALLHRR